MLYKNNSKLSVSLEELAILFSLVGHPDKGKILLTSNYGELNPDEERGRLLAANHTLMAKQVLTLQNGKPVLEKKIIKIIQSLITQDFLLRISRIEKGSEYVLAYYFQPSLVIEHTIQDAVIHHFRVIEDKKNIYSMGQEFLHMEDIKVFDCPIIELSQQELEEVRELAAISSKKAQDVLLQKNVSQITAKLLSQDMKQDVCRGTVMRVEEDGGIPIADQGFLLLKGKSRRAWLFEIFVKQDQPMVRILPFTNTLFRDYVLRLISESSENKTNNDIV